MHTPYYIPVTGSLHQGLNRHITMKPAVARTVGYRYQVTGIPYRLVAHVIELGQNIIRIPICIVASNIAPICLL